MMTPTEAIETANHVLTMLGEAPIPSPTSGTREEQISAVLHEYARRLRLKEPKYNLIADDHKLPDIVIQRLSAALKE